VSTSQPFHAGELALQTATGVRAEAARIGRAIGSQIAANAADFIARQQLAVVATLDSADRPVCSALVGEPGAFDVIDPVTLSVDIRCGIAGDRLADRISNGASAGFLFLEVTTRRRYRVNGTVIGTDDGRLLVRVAEAYANCPKYIQRRTLDITSDRDEPANLGEGFGLEHVLLDAVAGADTFFIASAGPEGKLDASHRGGRAGFVRVDGDRLWIPDYSGNNMYNTLGNLATNPSAGLLFVDFETGRTLQLSGTTTIDLDARDATDASGSGTGRAWSFTTDSWSCSNLGARVRSEMLEMSPFNP